MNPGAAFRGKVPAFRFYVDFLIHAIKTWFTRFIPLRLFLHNHGHSPFHVKSYQTLYVYDNTIILNCQYYIYK